MSSCLFCRIAQGQIPADVVYQDELCLAFRDIAPQAPVHTLVIPKKHLTSLAEASESDAGLLGHLLWVAARTAREAGIEEPGYRVVVNTNAAGGQSVYHLHLHVLGGRVMRWPPG